MSTQVNSRYQRPAGQALSTGRWLPIYVDWFGECAGGPNRCSYALVARTGYPLLAGYNNAIVGQMQVARYVRKK